MVKIKLIRAENYGTRSGVFRKNKVYIVGNREADDLLSKRTEAGLPYFAKATDDDVETAAQTVDKTEAQAKAVTPKKAAPKKSARKAPPKAPPKVEEPDGDDSGETGDDGEDEGGVSV